MQALLHISVILICHLQLVGMCSQSGVCVIYCLSGTGGIQRPPLLCFPGHYCPAGTMFPTQYKCPVGTWSGHSGLEAERECQPCPQSWYCLAGSGAPSGRCSSGHYCPEGKQKGLVGASEGNF